MRCERKWGTVVFGKHVVHTCMCVYAGGDQVVSNASSTCNDQESSIILFDTKRGVMFRV
jgi:hypothetical protein